MGISQTNHIRQTAFCTQLPPVRYSVSNADDPTGYNCTKNKVSRAAWLIFSIIIFPLGLARLAKKLINRAVAKYLIVRSTILPKDVLDLKRAHLMSNPEISNHCERICIETIDKVKIDTIMVKSFSQNEKAIQEQKFIVYFQGNGTGYEDVLDELVSLSKSTKTNVFVGNYRGVGASEGVSESYKDLENDGIAMIQYLLSLGVKPENILIHGWSLGGGVGAHVAVHYQKQGHEMHYCNDRSFSTLYDQIDTVISIIQKKILKYSPIRYPKILVKLLSSGRIFKYLLNWNFDTVKCYQSIKGKKIILYHPKDWAIRYDASLHKKIKNSLTNPQEAILFDDCNKDEAHIKPIQYFKKGYELYKQHLIHVFNN